MTIENELYTRSDSSCELCSSKDGLVVFEVPPVSDITPNTCALICNTCKEQIDDADKMDANHWRCLNDSMWSQIPAVQVLAWRMLTRLCAEGWPQDLLDMLYMDDDTLEWAKVTEGLSNEDTIKHLDSNGTLLEAGDTVTLIKDLNVKGANFTAKRGTAVRGISLVPDNPEQIEGRVEGQRIVILTRYVKKAS